MNAIDWYNWLDEPKIKPMPNIDATSGHGVIDLDGNVIQVQPYSIPNTVQVRIRCRDCGREYKTMLQVFRSGETCATLPCPQCRSIIKTTTEVKIVLEVRVAT